MKSDESTDTGAATLTGASTPACVEAALFDVFGTVVNWRGGLIAALNEVQKEIGIQRDCGEIADAWHKAYLRRGSQICAGIQPWMDMDALNAEIIDELIGQFSLRGIMPNHRRRLVLAWHQFSPWSDVVPGLSRIKRSLLIAPLSSGHTALLAALAKNAGLPWDLLISSELFNQYKPHPSVYIGACKLLHRTPERVLMVASHQEDLAAARDIGLRTAFVFRRDEFGVGAVRPELTGRWDYLADDFNSLANQLAASCPEGAWRNYASR